MKKNTVFTVAWMALFAITAKGVLPIELGEAEHFTLLAYSTITYPGSGTVIGDIGVHPGGGASTLVPASVVTGTVYARDAGYTLGAAVIDDGLLNTAKLDLGTAYTTAAGLPAGVGPNLNPGPVVPGHIGGMTLAPGVYTFDTGTDAFIDGADLTLSGGPNDVWVFQMGRALFVEAGVNRSVILAGGAQAKNVFWQVGSSATLGTYSVFKGTIMAYASVILDVGSQLEGRALALNEQVVFNGLTANMPLSPDLTLTVISEHGTGTPPAGLPPWGIVYTNAYGTVLTNSISVMEMFGTTTQYVNTGWSMIGNEPLSGTTNTMGMVHTNDAVLTWNWSTNYYLALTAVNGAITNEPAGWKPAGWMYDLYPSPDFGYAFDYWEVNGVSNGVAVPLNATMDEAKSVVAFFSPIFVDVSSNVVWNIDGLFDPRKGYYIGTLAISNNSDKIIMAPVWFEVQSTIYHWLRHPTGLDAQTGYHYLDISAAVGTLNPGDSATVGGIELMGRRTTDGILMALWADPPGLSIPNLGALDTDGDGIPNAWESLNTGVLSLNNPLDASLDSDLDGMSNGDEYVADTDPGDSRSLFTIRTGAGNVREVVWNGSPDRVYTVWGTASLREPFTVLASGIVGAGAETVFTDASDEAVGSAFYYVEVDVK